MPASYTVFICDFCGFKVRTAKDQPINVAPESWIIFSTHDMPGGQAMVCGWECLVRYGRQRAQGGPAELPYNDKPCRCGEQHDFDPRPRSRTLPPPEFRQEAADQHGHEHPVPAPLPIYEPEDDFPWREGEARIPFQPEDVRLIRSERVEQPDGGRRPCTDCEKKRSQRHAH